MGLRLVVANTDSGRQKLTKERLLLPLPKSTRQALLTHYLSKLVSH